VTVDPAITRCWASSGRGCSSRSEPRWTEACPDLSGADDVFGTLRPWLFEADRSGISPAAPRIRSRSPSAGTPRWGRSSAAPDLAPRGDRAHEAVRADGRVLRGLRRPAGADHQCCVLGGASSTRRRSGECRRRNYLEWMRSCTVISATGCPALSVPGGFTAGRAAGGAADHGAPRADRGCSSRARLRAGDRSSAPPPSPDLLRPL
jgi:amidase